MLLSQPFEQHCRLSFVTLNFIYAQQACCNIEVTPHAGSGRAIQLSLQHADQQLRTGLCRKAPRDFFGTINVKQHRRRHTPWFARGTVATVRGPVSVVWRLTADKLELTCTAPQGTKVEFVNNDSLAGKTVMFNGSQVK